MKKNNLFLKLTSALMAVVFLAMSSMMLTSCGDDDEVETDPEPENSILEILAADAQTSGILELLEAEDLDAAITADGSYTLFAPTNAALDELLATLSIPEFSIVAEDIRRAVLTYHLANAVYLADDLPATITTVQGEVITVNGNNLESGATSDAQITESTLATNGVVHKINKVLVPPSVGLAIVSNIGLLTQPILLVESFSYLNQAINWADSDETVPADQKLFALLKDPTANYTVFAPVNQTFDTAAARAGVTVTQFIESFNKQALRGFILNHLVPRDTDVEPAELITGASFPTALPNGALTFFNNTDAIPPQNGVGIYIDANGDVDLNDPNTYGNFDAEVALPNAFDANNGRLHAIAGFLNPSPASN